MLKQNNFGALSAEYRIARRGYPKEVYDYLKQLVPKSGLKTLDLGCGTGISTRELKAAGLDVTGMDKDAEMLRVASEDSPGISFVAGFAEEIPFGDAGFDIVTAFTSFHWFQNEKSLAEIKRVLKPGGLFFVALKESVSIGTSKTSWKEYSTILKKYVGENWNSMRSYDPKPFLESAGFSGIEENDFPMDEFYTVEESLVLMKSLSFWNLVPEERQEEYLCELKGFFEKNSTDGLVLRKRSIETVIGYKK